MAPVTEEGYKYLQMLSFLLSHRWYKVEGLKNGEAMFFWSSPCGFYKSLEIHEAYEVAVRQLENSL